MTVRPGSTFAFLALLCTVAACEERPAPAPLAIMDPTAAGTDVPLPGAPAARPLERIGGGTGSPLVLARFEGKKLALVADEDARAVRVVDPATRSQLSVTPLGAKPAQIVVAADGRAYVTLRDQAKVIALEASGAEPTLVVKADLPVADEPVGVAVTKDGATLLVTSAWGARLQAFAVSSRHQTFEVALAREPRGVTASADGRYAYVAHTIGSHLSRVALDGEHEVTRVAFDGFDFRPQARFIGCVLRASDFDGGSVGFRGDGFVDWLPERRDLVQGFVVTEAAGTIQAPMVIVHRGEVQVGGYGTSEGFPPHEATVATVDGEGATHLRVFGIDYAVEKGRYGQSGNDGGCLLPRAIAASADGVVVGCLGIDQVRLYGATSGALGKTMTASWRVPKGPTGVAVDDESHTLVVWSQFARSISTIDLAAKPAVKAGALPPSVENATVLPAVEAGEGVHVLSAAAQRGREIFHGAGDKRLSADGRACASCHPDGRDDGLSWPTPTGQRQTPMLAGRLAKDTAPYGWHGDAPTIVDHLKQTFTRLGGKGLTEEETTALLAYLDEMDTPHAGIAADEAAIARGREIFQSDSVGCGSCHRNGGGSDGARHTVDSGAELETPSLRFVAGTAPYFHDGRYQTLGELLRATQGKMGWGQLGEEDLRAVEAYLMTL
jgi:DNA-binding beta-propeller fold protein YncE/mono/diheme cytochrome c family protein/cytochrome c553